MNDEKRTLTDGSPVTPDHREIQPNGQQKGYVVLSDDERAKGFVEPVRPAYVHEKCGTVTTMSRSIAETYARNPEFYSGTFCVGCRNHFPVGPEGQFVWDGTNQKVGTRQPTETPSDAPDQFCVTREDGECISEDPRCMHNFTATTPMMNDALIKEVEEASLTCPPQYVGLLTRVIAALQPTERPTHRGIVPVCVTGKVTPK